MLTDFDGKRTLQKKCAPRGQHNSPGKEHALKAHTEVLLESMFLRELFSPFKKQRIKTALVEAPAAESAALGSFVQFFSPVTFSNNTYKGLFLHKNVRLLKHNKKIF